MQNNVSDEYLTHYNLDFVFNDMLDETSKAVCSSYEFDSKLSFREYDNCKYITFPQIQNGVAFDKFGSRILESETLCPNVNNYNPLDIDINVPCSIFPNTAILIGNIPFAFGHSFTDGFKSFWFVLSDAYKNLVSKGAIPILFLPANSRDKLPSYWSFFLRCFGIDVQNVVCISENTCFNNLIIPDLCWGYDKNGQIYYTREYKYLIDLITRSIDLNFKFPKLRFDKVYLTRTKFSNWKREVGEKTIEKLFNMEGYTIISPEEHPIEEQIYILRNCNKLVSTEGSISHAFVFCKPNTEVVVLRKTRWINPYQLAINQLSDLFVTIIDVNRTKVPSKVWNRMSGPFYLCITSELKHYIGKPFYILPTILCPSYWWYCFRLNTWVSRNIMNRKIVHKIENWFDSL